MPERQRRGAFIRQCGERLWKFTHSDHHAPVGGDSRRPTHGRNSLSRLESHHGSYLSYRYLCPHHAGDHRLVVSSSAESGVLPRPSLAGFRLQRSSYDRPKRSICSSFQYGRNDPGVPAQSGDARNAHRTIPTKPSLVRQLHDLKPHPHTRLAFLLAAPPHIHTYRARHVRYIQPASSAIHSIRDLRP